MEAALGIASVDLEVVAIEARRLQQRPPAPVIPIRAAAGEKRPPPGLRGYDDLLAGAGQ